MAAPHCSLAPLLLLLVAVSTASAVRSVPQGDKLQELCNKTLFPRVCVGSLATNPEARTADARRLAELSVYVTKEVGTTVAAFAHRELSDARDDGVLFRCLDSCSQDVEEAVAHLSALTRDLSDAKFLEVKAWLAATLGGSSTCEDSCEDAPVSDVKNAVVTKSLEFEKLLRVTLDLITEASGSMAAEVSLPPDASWGAGAPDASYGAAAPDSSSYGAGAPDSSSYGTGPSPSSSAPSYGNANAPSSASAPGQA